MLEFKERNVTEISRDLSIGTQYYTNLEVQSRRAVENKQEVVKIGGWL